MTEEQKGLQKLDADTFLKTSEISPMAIDLTQYEMVEREFPIDEKLIVVIGKGSSWFDKKKQEQVTMRGSALIEAPAYDIIGREMGIKFDEVQIISEDGWRVTVGIRCVYFNSQAQVVSDADVVTEDCALQLLETRAKWVSKESWDYDPNKGKRVKTLKKYKITDKETGETWENCIEPIKKLDGVDENGNPKIKYLLPDEVEIELWENYLTKRKNMKKKAVTRVKTRLIQRACGARGIKFDPNDPNWIKEASLKIPCLVPKGMNVDSVETVADVIYEDVDTRDEKRAQVREVKKQLLLKCKEVLLTKGYDYKEVAEAKKAELEIKSLGVLDVPVIQAWLKEIEALPSAPKEKGDDKKDEPKKEPAAKVGTDEKKQPEGADKEDKGQDKEADKERAETEKDEAIEEENTISHPDAEPPQSELDLDDDDEEENPFD